MSSDFESYEQDFAVLTADITGRIGRVPKLLGGGEAMKNTCKIKTSSSPEVPVSSCGDGLESLRKRIMIQDEKKQMIANIEKQLEEARELLEQMELEVREIPPQSRGMYSSRMRSYKQEMGKLEADFGSEDKRPELKLGLLLAKDIRPVLKLHIYYLFDSNVVNVHYSMPRKTQKRSRIAYSDEVRNELLGDDGNSSENQRAHLLDNTERLERSSRRLEAGYQIAVETDFHISHINGRNRLSFLNNCFKLVQNDLSSTVDDSGPFTKKSK
ncbi:UNVERIFIED_CONTAM: hypothetical protein H355_009282 [Colinus virginianus]|nr:hypothetical protein H355_009282 [Colinus virginianus]